MDLETRRQIAGVKAWYDQIAISFRERYRGSRGEFWRLLEENLALDLLDRDPTDPAFSRILDLGCGPGRLSASLSQRASLVIGVDLAPRMVFLAHGEYANETAMYAISDAMQSGLKASSFDAVVSLGMFEYLKEPSPFLVEILRVLKSGGKVIFTCHNRTLMSVLRRSLMRRMRRPGTERDSFYRLVDNSPKEMLALLTRQGFVATGFRGFHFRVSTRLLRFAQERLSAGMVRRTCSAIAVGIDRFFGKGALRSFAPLAMYTARKP